MSYDPSEARDAGGKWTAGGEGAAGAQTANEARIHAQMIANGRAPLAGLPQVPMKLKDGWYVPGPMDRLKTAAENYMRQNGMDPNTEPKTYQMADPAQGAKIAQAFEDMPHNPDDPATKASYAALAKEVMAQWQSIKATGLKVDWIKPGQPDPYADTPRSAERDVSENNHWWGFPTDEGFGSDPNLKGNPMLADSGEKIGGREASINDVFRVVHDMYGHIANGNGFSPSGEENAWRSHYAMFSDAARPAMTTETRGQSEWVNFGPHGASNRAALYGANAVSSNTGGAGVIYAPQKIGLLPKWAQDGARDKDKS
jgi:hypothetical protein